MHCSCMPVSPGFLNMNRLAQNLLSYTNFCDRLILPHLTILYEQGTIDDVALGVLFLASDESSYMTGAELVIDGGVTAQ